MLAILFVTHKIGIYILTSPLIGIDSAPLTLCYVLELAGPVVPQSLFISQLQEGTFICMCGNDAGTIYYKLQNVQALTEAGKPTMVA